MRFWIIILILFTGFSAQSQAIYFVAEDSIMGEFTEFSVDNFGRVYLCKDDVISQHYSLNDTVYTASLKTFRPTSIESSKSFRTLVFDQERSVVRFFDNTLTDIHGEIDLVNVGIQQPVLVCESFAGNTFWVLDGGMMRLVKLNQELEIVSQTENLVTLFENDTLPVQMLEYSDFLYVLIPGKGVAIFDVFGTFVKIYPTTATSIGAIGDFLLLQTDDRIEFVKTDSFLMSDYYFRIPQGAQSFYFSKEEVYVLLDDKLLIGDFVK